MRWRWLLLLVVSYFVYLLVGGGIFMAIERSTELSNCENAKKEVDAILGVNRNITCIPLTDLRDLTLLLSNAAANGVFINTTDWSTTCTTNWDFQNAFFFSGTVVTTIGYGNISPGTYWGRSFCIIYALIGIPLFAVMFSGLGDKIAKQVKRLDKKLKIKTKRQWVHRLILILVVSALLCILCLLIPAAIFTAAEEWSYHDSFYYSFITLTTIGFGDFVVGTNEDISYIPIYRVLVYFWIVFGLAFMATAVSLISDFMKKTGGRAASRIDDIINTDNESGSGDEERAEADGGSVNEETPKEEKISMETKLNSNQNSNYGANDETERTEVKNEDATSPPEN